MVAGWAVVVRWIPLRSEIAPKQAPGRQGVHPLELSSVMRAVLGWVKAADSALSSPSLCFGTTGRGLNYVALHQGPASGRIRVHSCENWFLQTPTATDVVGHCGEPD